jgi:GAF domain-containing protein
LPEWALTGSVNTKKEASALLSFRTVRELRESLDVSMSIQGADMGLIQVVDNEANLRIIAQRGFTREFLRYFKKVRANDSSACGRAFRAASAVSITDVQEDAGFAPHRGIARSAGFRAVQCAPLVRADGNVNGVLSVHYRAALPNAQWRIGKLYESALRTSVILDCCTAQA